MLRPLLTEHVLPISHHRLPNLLDGGEVHEMAGSVHLVVELLGVGQCQLVWHVGVMSYSHEVVFHEPWLGTIK